MSDINLQQCDYDFWTRAAYWTVEEGAAISMGLNPNIKNLTETVESSQAEKLKQITDLAKRAQKVDALGEFPHPVEFLEWLCSIDFVDITASLLRDGSEASFFTSIDRRNRGHWDSTFSFIDYKLSYEALEKIYFIQRDKLQELQRENWEYMEEFEGIEIEQYARTQKPKIFEERQRKTMLKLLLAIAIEKYRFNPTLERSSVPKNIEATTDLYGLNVTNETIREYLKKAVSEFPSVLNLFGDKSQKE